MKKNKNKLKKNYNKKFHLSEDINQTTLKIIQVNVTLIRINLQGN